MLHVPMKLGADYLEQVGLFYWIDSAKQVDHEIEVICTELTWPTTVDNKKILKYWMIVSVYCLKWPICCILNLSQEYRIMIMLALTLDIVPNKILLFQSYKF